MRNRRLTQLSTLTLLCLICVSIAVPTVGAAPRSPQATVVHYGGSYASWPTTWIPLSALNDPSDATPNEQVDVVGDSTDPGVYWYSTADYLFFRVRVDFDGPVTISSPFADAAFVFIDIVGTGTTGDPDHAIVWDSKGTPTTSHGEEMMKPNTEGSTWNALRMNDVDGLHAAKTLSPCPTCDFGLANGDGYTRTIDGQSTTSFGNTTFIDFAVKWSYLELYTALRRSGQTWRIQVGSLANATDHNPITGDVGGGYTPASTVTSCWSKTLNPSDPLAVNLALFTAFPGPGGVTLSWETVSEQGNAGFNLYRSESEAGPWTQLNAALIPSVAPGSGGGHGYEWIDTTARPGMRYSYRLDGVNQDGTVETLGVISVSYKAVLRQWLPRLGRQLGNSGPDKLVTLPGTRVYLARLHPTRCLRASTPPARTACSSLLWSPVPGPTAT